MFCHSYERRSSQKPNNIYIYYISLIFRGLRLYCLFWFSIWNHATHWWYLTRYDPDTFHALLCSVVDWHYSVLPLSFRITSLSSEQRVNWLRESKSWHNHNKTNHNNVVWTFTQNTTITNRISMMTSSNGNIFRVTGHLCGEFTGLRWIPRTKASDAELWYFLWSASE